MFSRFPCFPRWCSKDGIESSFEIEAKKVSFGPLHLGLEILTAMMNTFHCSFPVEATNMTLLSRICV